MASEDPEKQKEVRKYLQQSHDRIFENNKKWADEMKAKKPEFFSDLSAGQAPEYLWIGELDSSFTPTLLRRTRDTMTSKDAY
jgi:carbonic anhydrase